MKTKDKTQNIFYIIVIFLIIFTIVTFFYFVIGKNNYKRNNIREVIANSEEIITIQNDSGDINSGELLNEQDVENEDILKNKITKITINAAGDCTIGYDTNFGYTNSFNEYLEKNNYEYFFSNMKELFENDDLTVVNLEGTFTDSNQKVEKKFNFKGAKDYVNVLTSGDIEVVNIANNHTRDYGQEGYDDTIETLEEAGVNYFGYKKYYIYEKDDIKVGFAGIYSIENMNCTSSIDQAISYFKENDVNTIILSFHWGIERSYAQSTLQQKVAHYAIDNGADLILGHHPHVLQGIECYKNKYIVYSLGNFSFGGNKNPPDKDTMVFNITYTYENEELKDTEVVIYPASVSSVNNKNDYKPTLLKGSEYTRVLSKIIKNSKGLEIKTNIKSESE